MEYRSINLRDDLFKGAVSLEHTAEGITPWRIPYQEYDLFPPNGIGGKSRDAAGVRLCFQSNTNSMELVFAPSSNELTVDCVVNGAVKATGRIEPGGTVLRFDGLGNDQKEIEVFFSQKFPVKISGLRVEAKADLSPCQFRPRWVTYGSSITQCGAANSPAFTWPAIVARRAKLDLTCLGYGGNCMIEPMVARMIRDLPAEYISLCLGINVYGQSALSPRTFKSAVIGFIQTIREKHPNTPMTVMSPIISPPRETKENSVGMTLVKMREQIAEVVLMLQGRGDEHIHYVNGMDLFNESLIDYLPDQLHPNHEGYGILADRFEQRVVKQLWNL
ncbi:SGNH/GDSL hydrolase family protein [Paenibacillus allorhizosphaerae]|uniref:GDSL family lipase n=1 Tax=Paenibacillus allorhizosphaerae TaxID=2849866 RepID=A0ABN7TWP8_9BACL|nr:SGNH/GDSL hydrolase family protein [Paenibacillus allorhizosphaerae]CAG7658750.1 hypothetical protein PAECIP111802_07154 [Paenibacillus allorhizosphaerae]